MREIVRELDPGVPVFEAIAMTEVVARSMARLQLLLVAIGAAAVVTLALGMLGLYGVLAFRVALRTREFGRQLRVDACQATRSPRRLASAAGSTIALGCRVETETRHSRGRPPLAAFVNRPLGRRH